MIASTTRLESYIRGIVTLVDVLAIFGGAFGLVVFVSSGWHNWYMRRQLKRIADSLEKL